MDNTARLSNVQFQVRELLSLIDQDEKRRLGRHAEERVVIETMVASLQQSYEILKKEKKRLKAELQERLAKATASTSTTKVSKSALAEQAERDADVVDLQSKLIDLNNRLLDIDFEVEKVTNELVVCKRPDEKELLSTKMVVMRDTKRILQSEIDALRSNIFRLETATQVEADKRSAEETGYAALGRVEEQMQRITTRIDRAKQQIYFPAAKGYRFSTGAGGVYMAAQDLFLSEISGRVTFTCQKVTRADGLSAARVCVTVEGVSNTNDWAEGSSRRNAPSTPAPTPSGSTRLYPDNSASSAQSAPAAVQPVPSSGAAAPASEGGTSQPSTPSLPATSPVNSFTPAPAPALDTTPTLAGFAQEDLDPLVGLIPPQQQVPDVLMDTNSSQPAGPVAVGNSTPPRSEADPFDFGPIGNALTEAVVAAPIPPEDWDPLQGPPLPQQPALAQPAPAQPAAAQLAPAQEQPTPAQAQSAAAQLAATQLASATAQPAPGAGLPVASGEPGTGRRDVGPMEAAVAGGLARIATVPAGYQAAAQAAAASSGGRPPPHTPSSQGGRTPTSQGDGFSPSAYQHHQDSPKRKGEMMSGFLTSLGKRKDKFKEMVAGHSSSLGGAPGGSSGGSSASGSAGGAVGGSDGGTGGRLGLRMGKLRDGLGSSVGKVKEGLGGMNLGSRMDEMKKGLGNIDFGSRMERVKEELGGHMGRVKDTLAEGMQDGRGKLSKLVTMKGTISRNSAGGQPATSDRANGSNPPSHRTSADFHHPDATNSRMGAHASSAGGASNTAHGHHHQGHPGPLPHSQSTGFPAGTASHTRRGSAESLASTSATRPSESGSVAAEAGSTASGEANLSVAFEEFATQQTRKGLYVQLLGERVQLVGERGTKVPDMAIREFMLEVEVAMNMVIDWTSLTGWQVPDSHPLELSILQLDHKMRGNSIPLPRTALKALLNMFLPGIMMRLLVASMPPELGSYIVQSGEQLQLGGEFRVRGPALSTYMAPLVVLPLSKHAQADPVRRGVWITQAAAAARARQLLGLTEMQAEVLNQLFAGPYALLDPPRPASLCELCRMLVAYNTSSMWAPLCAQWNKALQVLFDIQNVPSADRLSFMGFMEGPVARIVRKPVQVAFMMDQLQVNIDVDALLNTLHDLFARLVVDLHKRSQRGDDNVAVPTEPLPVQLEALQLWHGALSMQLRTFKSRFRTASCGLVVAADREVFQFGAENLSYDGPMRIRLPLDVLVDQDHSFVMDVKLPGRDEYVSGMTNMLQEIMAGLSAVRESQDGTSVNGGAGLGSQRNSVDVGGKHASAGGATTASQDHAAYLEQWQDMLGRTGGELLEHRRSTRGVSGDGRSSADGQGEDDGPALQVPVLANPVVGQLSIRKAAVSLRLDEERMAELLQSSTNLDLGNFSGLLGTLLGCYGELFSASLDVGWRPDQGPSAAEGATRPACMLTVANNEVTRVMASLESLIFSSTVSPRLAVSVLSAVVNGIMLRFYAKRSYQVRFWQRIFKHLYEYLGRDALDALICLSARLEVVKGPLSNKLRLMLQGDTRLAPGAASPPSPAGAPSPGTSPQQHPVPVYLLNEINLLTLLDSVKLLSGQTGQDDR